MSADANKSLKKYCISRFADVLLRVMMFHSFNGSKSGDQYNIVVPILLLSLWLLNAQ